MTEINGSKSILFKSVAAGVAVIEITDQVADCMSLTQLIKVPGITGSDEQDTGDQDGDPELLL